MGQYGAKAESAITTAITVPGQAIDPATVIAAVGMIIELLKGCRGKGATKQQMVAEVRDPGAGTRRKFRKKLEAELGETEYKARGGHKYANKMLAAASNASVADIKGFVAEACE